MLIDRTSSPSTGVAVMVSGIAVPSTPLAVKTVPARLGASGPGLTGTAISWGADVATCRAGGGVAVTCSGQGVSPPLILRPTGDGAAGVQLPPAWLVPADSVASLGTPVMLIDRTSSPSTGVAVMVSGIAVPSLPLAVSTVPARLGASEAGVTVSVMVCGAD